MAWQKELLRLATLQLLTSAFISKADSSLCATGQCLNCISCAGDCDGSCQCYPAIQACCCHAPVGYYSRGWGKISCPAGTYQDRTGGGICKACNSSTTAYYNSSRGGARNLYECTEQLCECDSSNTTCLQEECQTPEDVQVKMLARPPDQAWCSQQNIPLK